MATGIHLGPFSLLPDSPSRILRGNYGGALQLGDRPLPVKYVLDPSTGCPVIPLSADGPDAIPDEDADSLVIMIPDEGDESLQLQCSVVDIDPRTHEAPDRHLIYHGPSHQRRWGLLRVQAARVANKVFDALLIVAANPLRTAEPSLCKWANSRKEALAQLAKSRLTGGGDLSVMVGIDPMGIDLRTRFGPQRIDFETPAMDISQAQSRLHELLEPAARPSREGGAT